MMVRPKKAGHLLEEALMELPKSAKKQYAIIDFFIEYPEEISQKLLLKKFQTTNSTVKTLVNKNLLEIKFNGILFLLQYSCTCSMQFGMYGHCKL